MKNTLKWLLSQPGLVTVSLIIALTSIVGSLYFSEIEGHLPCDLCWWQRVLIYPQGILMGVALYGKDWRVYRYSLPLLGLGWLVAAAQTVSYYQVNFFNTAPAVPCPVTGPSCTERYVEYFGFVSIPLLSLVALTIMIGAMLLLRRQNNATT